MTHMGVVARVVAVCTALLAALASPSEARATNDTFFGEQWNLQRIGAPAGWSASTGAGVTIGVVDTGVDAGHPDLQSKIDATANCLGGTCREGRANDGHGHGTLVSGIAAAATGNGRGVAGVAPDARLVVAKAVDENGTGAVEDINAGIRWVVDRGARVVNLSLGDPNFLFVSLLGTPLRPGIEYAWSRGAVPVLASGNENVGLLDLGSSNYGNLNALVVGATARSGTLAGYSSSIGNAKWGLVAPGGSGDGPSHDILSTYLDGRYAWAAGTSMAAPHVSGAVALLLAQGLSPAAAVQRILATLDRSARCGGGCQGALDLRAALASAASPGTTAAVPQAPVTTSAPPATPDTTTTVVEMPTTTVVGSGIEAVPPSPRRRVLAAGPLEPGAAKERNPAVLGLAVVLLLASASAAAGVAWRRR